MPSTYTYSLPSGPFSERIFPLRTRFRTDSSLMPRLRAAFSTVILATTPIPFYHEASTYRPPTVRRHIRLASDTSYPPVRSLAPSPYIWPVRAQNALNVARDETRPVVEIQVKNG